MAGNKDGIIGVYITCMTIFKIDFQHVMEPDIWLSKVWIPIYNYSYRKFIYVSILKPRR